MQSAIGNLPELFVAFFALQSVLVGSILANSLLVLDLAFLVGGLKNGIQKFQSEMPRAIAILLVLAVSALVFPTPAHTMHTLAEAHEILLSVASAIVLALTAVPSVLIVYDGESNWLEGVALIGLYAIVAMSFGGIGIHADPFWTPRLELDASS